MWFGSSCSQPFTSGRAKSALPALRPVFKKGGALLPFLYFEGDEMRYWGMIILGIGGTAILLGLGVWQVQRLAWKAEILAQIERKILAPAVDIPAQVAQIGRASCRERV